MEAETMQKAAKLSALDALAANYGAAFNPTLKGMWLDLLAEYRADHVRAAVLKVIQNYEYKTLPPFAVLQKALDELSGAGAKAVELQAVAEWGILSDAVLDSYNRPDFHPTTEFVMMLMGGWETACDWRMSDLDFKRKDFIKLWMDSHGRVEYMRLGADAVRKSLVREHGGGPRPLGDAIAKLTAGETRQ
jgi:hypothetical protein